MVTVTIENAADAAAASSPNITQPPTAMSEEQVSQSPPPERSSERLRSRLETPKKGAADDEEEVDVVLARTSPSVIYPLKLYHCPACEANDMSGEKLKEHFRAEHKDLMTAANKGATGANTGNKSMGTWSETECQTFEAGCIIFGWGKWASILTLMSTRDKAQIKSHAQKFMIHRNDEYRELIAYHNGDDLSDNFSSKSSISSGSNGNDSSTSSSAGGSPSWTEEEQEQFKMGVIVNGWGSWKEIAKNVPTKSVSQIRSRAHNIKRHKQDEEARLKAQHAKLVSRNPQRYSNDYVSRVTGAAKAEDSNALNESAPAVKPRSPKTPTPTTPNKTKSPKSSTSSQSSVRSLTKMHLTDLTTCSSQSSERSAKNHITEISKKRSGYSEGTWTLDEHDTFEQAVIKYGWGDWVNVTAQIPTRDKKQVKSHAQKFDLHHPGGKDRLVGEHNLRKKRKKTVGAKKESAKKKKAEKEKTDAAMEVVEDRQQKTAEGKTADAAMIDATFEESDKMEVEQLDDTNYQEKQRVQEGESTEEERKEDGKEKEEDDEASTISSEESRQQLRVSPRVVKKAPRDNYIDSLQKEQWQRKKKTSDPNNPKRNVGGVRQCNDGLYEVRIWYARKFCHIGIFDSEALAQVAHRIASDILRPETTPSDSAAVEWNIKIARDAAVDGVKLAERDADGGGELGLLEPPKAIQNYLLGGHMVSAGEQTIKHRLFATATATKSETNLAHFTVTCTNGPIHVDVGINDSLFDLRRKIFDQFDSSQLDDGNCNFNFQVDTNMISRKVEGSFIARDLLQLNKSVELIPRSAVLSGESSQDVSPENGVTNQYEAREENSDEEEDLTSFYEAAGSAISSKLTKLANEIATATPTSTGPNQIQHPPKVVDFLHFLKESSTVAGDIDDSYFTELGYVYMMEKTGVHEKQVDKWISDAKKRFAKPMKVAQPPDAQTDTLKVDTLELTSGASQ